MKLVMTIFDEKGAVKKTQAISVSSNQMNRLNGPGLFGKNMYELRKKKEVEILIPDGKIRYALLNK